MTKRRIFLIIFIFVFGLVVVAYMAKQGLNEKKLKSLNEKLMKKGLTEKKLDDIGVTILAPEDFLKREAKIKEKDVIKNGVMYEINTGTFRLSVARFEYSKNYDPDVEKLMRAVILQLKQVSIEKSLNYEIEESKKGGFDIRSVVGQMKYKKVEAPIGFRVILMTKKKMFYQFVITYAKTGDDIEDFIRRIVSSIQVKYD